LKGRHRERSVAISIQTITNKIATVAALLRNDNFCEPAGPCIAGESYVQVSEIILFEEENDL
jgi:hypothetical protein